MMIIWDVLLTLPVPKGWGFLLQRYLPRGYSVVFAKLPKGRGFTAVSINYYSKKNLIQQMDVIVLYVCPECADISCGALC
jgi:hypothetical protein